MKNIFVGNLDFAATDSSLRALFEQYGTVDRVNLVKDRDTGRSRGFAFVEMSDSHQADQAIAGLNGVNFEGRRRGPAGVAKTVVFETEQRAVAVASR